MRQLCLSYVEKGYKVCIIVLPPFTHIESSIVFTYIYGPGDEQEFNFIQIFQNAPIKQAPE